MAEHQGAIATGPPGRNRSYPGDGRALRGGKDRRTLEMAIHMGNQIKL